MWKVLVVVPLLSLSVTLAAVKVQENDKSEKFIRLLKSQERTDQTKGYQDLIEFKKIVAETVMAVFKDPQLKKDKNIVSFIYACELSKEFVLSDTAPYLAEHLLLNTGCASVSMDNYPAVNALIRIGKPSIAPLLKAIADDRIRLDSYGSGLIRNKELTHGIASGILTEVSGKEIAKKEILEFKREISDEVQRKRLEEFEAYFSVN